MGLSLEFTVGKPWDFNPRILIYSDWFQRPICAKGFISHSYLQKSLKHFSERIYIFQATHLQVLRQEYQQSRVPTEPRTKGVNVYEVHIKATNCQTKYVLSSHLHKDLGVKFRFRIPGLSRSRRDPVVAEGVPFFSQPQLSLILRSFLSRYGQLNPYVQVPATPAHKEPPFGPWGAQRQYDLPSGRWT